MNKKGKGRAVRSRATSKTTFAHQSYSTSRHSAYRPERLPHPAEYYKQRGMNLIGSEELKSTVCPFHDDTNLSLRINLHSGGFCCEACGAQGDDVLAFHRLRYRLDSVVAAKLLGAWEEK